MSLGSSRKSALKLPGLPKNLKKTTKAEQILKIGTSPNESITHFDEKDVQALFSKKKDLAHIDFSSPVFQLESCSFLKEFPETIKEYVLERFNYILCLNLL